MVYIKGPAVDSCTLGIVMDVDSVCYENTPSLTCSYPNIMDMGNGR